MSTRHPGLFLCASLLLSVTALCQAKEETKDTKVTQKRHSVYSSDYGGSSFNNYYNTGSNYNKYGANDKIYFSGYGTGSGSNLGGYGSSNAGYFSGFGSGGLGNEGHFSTYGSGSDGYSGNGVNYIYNNGHSLVGNGHNYGLGNSYSVDNFKNYGAYAKGIGTYHTGNIGNVGYNTKTHTHSHHTVTKEIAIPQPYPVTVTKHVPVKVPQPYPVEVPKPVAVPVQVKVPIEVPKPYPVTVTQRIPYVVEKPVYVTKNIPVEVPRPYPVTVTQKVPYVVEKPVYVTKNIPVEVPKPYAVHVPKPVPVEVRVPVEVPKPYPVTVKEHVPYPVERKVYVKVPHPVKVEVPKPYPVPQPFEVKVPVYVKDVSVQNTGDLGTYVHNVGIHDLGLTSGGTSHGISEIAHGIGGGHHDYSGVGVIGHGSGQNTVFGNKDDCITYDVSGSGTGYHSHSNIKSGQVQTFTGTSGTYSGVYVPSSQGGLHGGGYNTHSKSWSW